MAEEISSRLEAFTARRRGRLPDIHVAVHTWPVETLTAARWVWARRVFNETGSIQIAQRLIAAASAAGVTDPDVTAALSRLEEDERAHSQLAEQVLTAIGGSPPPPPPASSDAGDASSAFMKLVLVGLVVCETVSAARYAAVRAHTNLPLFRECIELFLRDEVAHSELGFVLLPAALARLRETRGSAASAIVDDSLRRVFRELDQTVGLDAQRKGGLPPPRPQPANNPGVVEPALDARALYEAVENTIIPGLAAVGIDGRAAWARRWD